MILPHDDAIPREMKHLSQNTSETNISLAPKEHFLRLCKVFTKYLFNTLLFLQVPECRIVSTDAEKFELEVFCLFVCCQAHHSGAIACIHTVTIHSLTDSV